MFASKVTADFQAFASELFIKKGPVLIIINSPPKKSSLNGRCMWQSQLWGRKNCYRLITSQSNVFTLSLNATEHKKSQRCF